MPVWSYHMNNAVHFSYFFFFFNDPATTEIYTLSLHDALPIRDSGLAWTFLQPNGFMSNALRWLPQLDAGDVVREEFPNLRTATIDPFDIAAVAVAAFEKEEHRGQSCRLSGPQSLLAAERVAILGRVIGRDLRFEGLSNEEARAKM